MEQSTSLLSESFLKEDAFFDVPFTIEEVEHAVNRMKLSVFSQPFFPLLCCLGSTAGPLSFSPTLQPFLSLLY